MARNTQLILLEEANLWRVADPAAGAGGFEALTQGLCEQGWSKLQDLEREAADGLPGMVAALANGHVQQGLARQRVLRAKAIVTRREPITRTSELPNLGETSVSVLAVRRWRMALKRSLPRPGLTTEACRRCGWRRRLKRCAIKPTQHRRSAGKRPTVFLATLGAIADFTARAGFARNLFEAGGLAAPSGDGFASGNATDLAALVTASSRPRGARLACLCGSDAGYAGEAIAVAQALQAPKARASGSRAGPGDLESALNQAGVSASIFAGCDRSKRCAAPTPLRRPDGKTDELDPGFYEA